MPLFRRPGKGRSLPLVTVVTEVDPRTKHLLSRQRLQVKGSERSWQRARRGALEVAQRVGSGLGVFRAPKQAVMVPVGVETAGAVGAVAASVGASAGLAADAAATVSATTQQQGVQPDVGGGNSSAARTAAFGRSYHQMHGPHMTGSVLSMYDHLFGQKPTPFSPPGPPVDVGHILAFLQHGIPFPTPELAARWRQAEEATYQELRMSRAQAQAAAMFRPFQWFTKPSATTMRQGAVTTVARGASAGAGVLAMADLATSLGILPALMANPVTLAIMVLAAVGFATYALMDSAVKASQTLGTAASIDLSVSMNALKRELRLLGAEMGIVLLPVLTAFAKAAEWFVRFLRKNFVPQRWSLDLDYKGVAIDNTGRAIDISRGLTREERRLNWWRKVVGEVDRSRHPLPLDHAPGHWNQGFNPSSQMAQFEWMARHSEQMPSLQERVDDHFRAQQRIADEQAHQIVVTRGLQEAETVVDVIRFVAKQSFIDLANKAGIYFSYGGMEETE